MGFEALGNKLFLLGGCSEFLDSTDEVYSYDASSKCWAQATSLSTARYNFACEVSDEKLYVIGGGGSNSSDHSWETFDPLTNCWTSQTDPKIVSEIKHSVVLDRNIYVRCTSKYPVTPHVSAVVYKPSSGTWQYADDDMVSGWRGPVVVVDGTLYVLDQSLGRTRLMMSLKERREWIPVGRLLPSNARPPFQLVAVGKSIFIVGRVLSTVVVDVGDLGNEDQMIVGSALPGLLFDVNVISVKCLSI
ncbi:hypothetical protein JHK85_006173 [Glycine max]|uniref:F-box/kelch-repeat protein SKIP4 n=1 Tax=Glycine max TaxID=3847 RepID=UPI00023BCEEC|nr:F-box/kelch-repeat protein SKIP4 [Glycine max]KAG5053663.1 hypothetical protein JHK85_006173 [Glycine max]KAG5070802.1 hypothetical protein JHK86_006013 [Glycine max]|eukprot:XP_025983848.1 F-box/kelch-repeat protein SKIP4-like [Glycine max]